MGFTHQDVITDTDVLCTINTYNRKISNDSSKFNLTQYDHNSERIGFIMERYVDGHDMSLCDRIAIKYLNTTNSDMYIVDDLKVSEDENYITFTWLISGNVTELPGSVVFMINFRCYDEEGTITYNWSTQPCSTFTIIEGLYSMDSNPKELYDFWARYKGLVDTVKDDVKNLQSDTGQLFINSSDLEDELNNLSAICDKLEPSVSELEYSVPYLEGRTNALLELIDELEEDVNIIDRTLSEDQAYVINEEVTDLHNVLNDISILHKSVNLLDINSEEYVEGQFMDTNGVFTSSDTYFVTPYIEVESGQTIAATFNESTEDTLLRFVTAFSATKEVISDSGAINVYEYLVPDGVKYIRISILLRDDFYNYMVYLKTSNDRPLYEEYYEPYYTPLETPEIEKLKTQLSINKSSAIINSIDELPASTTLSIDSFPEMLKTGQKFSVSAKFLSFGETDSIKIGFINSDYDSYQGYLELTSTNVKWHLSTVKEVVNEEHNLLLTDYVNITASISADNAQLFIVINTLDGTFTYTQTNDSTRCNAIGTLSVIATMDITDVVLSATCSQFNCETWLIGDSYFGSGSSRVVGRLIEWGFTKGVLIAGLGGLNSELGYNELLKLLNFGTPKYLVWYLGMNDDSSDVDTYYPLIEDLCDTYGIELIFNKIPLVPTRLDEGNYVNSYVLQSGRRYVNSYDSVGADEDGVWYTSYLSDDGVHPSETGAAALASRLLVDVPEILNWR